VQVLYISNNSSFNKNESYSWFKPYCEFDDFHFYSSFEDAKEFLDQKVLGHQKHVDCIITHWNVGANNAVAFRDWIRNSEDSYSSKNFQFKSIPILLVEDKTTQSDTIGQGFNSIISDFPTDRFKLKSAIVNTIKSWRYLLASDLENIGLDPKILKIYPNDRYSFISYYRLVVLTRYFVDSKSKKLNYIWTNSNGHLLNRLNEEFHQHIQKAQYHPSKYMEKETHEFFNQNQSFLLGENFSRPLYERRLYKEGRYSDIPDFINDPFDHSLRYPEIFEIKRQTQRFIRDKERFISKAKKSFQQVKRYKEYMTSGDPRKQFYIKKYLGKLHDRYDYTLFMGSKNERDDNLDLIERLQKELNFDDIKLVTYEELLDKHVRMCDRLIEYDIFK
jgi:hypothetical protein